jgi:hypothetical protein
VSIIKVKIQDRGATGYSYAPPEVDGLLNTEAVVSVKPYHGRGSGLREYCIASLVGGDSVVVCSSVNDLWAKIERAREEVSA